MSDDRTCFRYSYGYIEDLGLTLTSKSDQPPFSQQPPRVRSKYYRNTYETAPLQQLTSPVGYTSFPSPLYNGNLKLPYYSQLFDVLGKLGEGSFGTAFKVRSKDDGKIYALKIAKEPFRSNNHRLQRLEEVKWQEELCIHRNILKIYNAWEEKHILYMQMELCKMTLTLYSVIHKNDITELVVWDVMIDMLAALEFMHGKSVLHLDVKPDNILIGYDGLYKLGDFGIVHVLDDNTREPVEGDPKYIAPELMYGKFSDVADVFSLGMSLLELACNVVLPSHGSTWRALRQNRLPRTQTQDLSKEFCDTISLFMKSCYWERPSATRLLGHPEIEKRRKARNKKLRYEEITKKMCGVISFLFLPVRTMCENIISVLSSFLPNSVPAICIDQVANEQNRTPPPSKNRPHYDYSSVIPLYKENQFTEDNREHRRKLLSSTVRRNLAASFSSDSE